MHLTPQQIGAKHNYTSASSFCEHKLIFYFILVPSFSFSTAKQDHNCRLFKVYQEYTVFFQFVFSRFIPFITVSMTYNKILISLNFLFQVCLEKMQDLQLALVISRLYESEFETASTYKKILQRHVLGQDKQVHSVFITDPASCCFF